MHPYLTHRNYLESSQPGVPAPHKRTKTSGGLRKWLRTAYRHWQRNKMIAAFQSLDDAVLRDIGVRRDDIRSVVDGLVDDDLIKVPVAATDGTRRW